MTDVTRSTMNLSAIAVLCLSIASGTWVCASRLNEIENALTNHTNQISDVQAKVDKISNRQDSDRTLEENKADDLMRTLRPTRWTWQMQEEYARQLQEANPSVHVPDVEKIHEEFQPLTQ